MAKFTDKQKAFINHYLISLNATDAAQKAGYKGNRRTLAAIGSENLTKPEIRAFVDECLREKKKPEWLSVNKGTSTSNITKNKYVYLIRESFMGLTKIGVATNLSGRFSSLQTACPQNLEIIGYIETKNPKIVESQLHKRFAHKRYRAEWFDLSSEDVKIILDYHNAHTAAVSQPSLFDVKSR